MLDYILARLSPTLLTVALVAFWPLILLAIHRPHICLALGIPVYLFMGIINLYFPISVSAASAVFPLLAMIGGVVRGNRISLTMCEKLLFVLAVLMLVSLGVSGNRDYGLDKAILFWTMCIPMVIVAPQVITSVGALRTVVQITTITMLAYAVTGVLVEPAMEGQRVSSWGLGDVTRAGQFFGLAAVIGIVRISLGTSGGLHRLLDLGMIVLGLVLSLRTGTRAAFVSLILTAGFLYWFVNLDWLKRFLNRLGTWIVVAIAAVPLLLAGPTLLSPFVSDEILSRFTSIEAIFSNFTRDEVVNWQDSETRTLNFFSAIEGMWSHPLRGVGAGGYSEVLSLYYRIPTTATGMVQVYPHNLLLEFGVEQGIPGLILILLVLYQNHKALLALRKTVASHRNEAFLIGYVTCFFIYGLCLSMTALDIPRMMILWWGMGLLLAANRVYAVGVGHLQQNGREWNDAESLRDYSNVQQGSLHRAGSEERSEPDVAGLRGAGLR